jgi:hypothetical protein
VPDLATALVFLVASVSPALSAGAGHGQVLQQPTSHGETIVGVLPGHGRTRSLAVRTAGRPAAPIPGIAPVDRNAVPRVGTDAAGREVVVYRRCPQGRCDLYSVRLDGTHERPIPGVSSRRGDEFVGAMDHGDVAFVRSAPKAAGGSGLFLRRVGERARLVTRRAGDEVALSGDHIAQRRDTDPGFGICGMPTVEVLTPDGRRRTIKRVGCGLDGQGFDSLSFVDDHLLFLAYNGSDGPARTRIYRTALDGSALEHADGPKTAVAYAPTGPDHGVALVGNDILPRAMRRVTGLEFRPAGG